MSKPIQGLLVVFLLFALGAGASAEVSSLSDIRSFSKRETLKLKRRYDTYKDNHELFTQDQFRVISQNGLSEVISRIILHKYIKLESPEELIEFAQILVDSPYSFKELEARMVKYIKGKEKIFEALTKAIERETRRRWKKSQIARAHEEAGPFVSAIGSINITQKDKDKAIKVYAVCIAPYNGVQDRTAFIPKICDPLSGYKKPRFQKTPAAVNHIDTVEDLDRAYAYQLLMDEARSVADNLRLDVFERVVLASCISENSLRFFKPKSDPINAIRKSIERNHQSPDEEFFEHSGVCSNFSGIIYNAAKSLGLEGHIHLARKGLHIYLEFENNGEWYHAHPFSSFTSCDMYRF